MNAMIARARTSAPLAAFAIAAACSGGGDGGPGAGPRIERFDATPAHFFPGEPVELHAVFTGGSGRIEPDGLPVSSGVPLRVGPFGSGRTFTLVVSDGTAEAQRELRVPLQYRHRLTVVAPSPTARAFHAAVLLEDGRVLVVAGQGVGSVSNSDSHVWDPATAAFAPAGTLAAPRSGLAGLRLPDGRVAIAGGESNAVGNAARVVEVWDPATGAWSALGELLSQHVEGTVSPLPLAGTPWLVAGGTPLDAGAELFDPSTGSSRRTTGSMRAIRAGHSATHLFGAKVLLAGGNLVPGAPLAEVYDGDADAFEDTVAAPATFRTQHVAVRLASTEQVLLAGGDDRDARPLAGAELYDLATGSFLATGSLNVARSNARAVELATGEVLVAGGIGLQDGVGPALVRLDSVETYDPLTGAFTLRTAKLAGPREGLSLTRLPDGRVLVIGGHPGTGFATTTVQIYD